MNIERKNFDWKSANLPQEMVVERENIYYLNYEFQSQETQIIKTSFTELDSEKVIYSMLFDEEGLSPPKMFPGVFDLNDSKILLAFTYNPKFELIHFDRNRGSYSVNSVEYQVTQEPFKLNEGGFIDGKISKRYYHDIYVSDRYIYLLYLGFSEAEALKNIENMKSEIHIYDLEGNSIEKLELVDNLINLFSIDEERRFILGHDVSLAQPLVLFKF